MRLFGIIGFPLLHSFSKKYFTEKFEKNHLADCKYEVFPLQSISEFPALLKSKPELKGLNVTIPHKKNVLAYLDDRSAIPEGLDACNCIKINGGKLYGYNTDVYGFEKSLRPLLKPWHNNALILGNGGAAAAVKSALTKSGIGFRIVSRTLHEDSDLTYGQLNKKMIEEHLLIINCTPLGMMPAIDVYPEIPYEYLTTRHLLYDLIYNPAKTKFLEKGEARGAAIKNGEEMLILQAEENWRIWNS
jgi:shikimate dehydrogenase